MSTFSWEDTEAKFTERAKNNDWMLEQLNSIAQLQLKHGAALQELIKSKGQPPHQQNSTDDGVSCLHSIGQLYIVLDNQGKNVPKFVKACRSIVSEDQKLFDQIKKAFKSKQAKYNKDYATYKQFAEGITQIEKDVKQKSTYFNTSKLSKLQSKIQQQRTLVENGEKDLKTFLHNCEQQLMQIMKNQKDVSFQIRTVLHDFIVLAPQQQASLPIFPVDQLILPAGQQPNLPSLQVLQNQEQLLQSQEVYIDQQTLQMIAQQPVETIV